MDPAQGGEYDTPHRSSTTRLITAIGALVVVVLTLYVLAVNYNLVSFPFQDRLIPQENQPISMKSPQDFVVESDKPDFVTTTVEYTESGFDPESYLLRSDGSSGIVAITNSSNSAVELVVVERPENSEPYPEVTVEQDQTIGFELYEQGVYQFRVTESGENFIVELVK